ncbi:MAG: hypothetical protein AB7V62_07965 [Thermoleophilia bacterium]
MISFFSRPLRLVALVVILGVAGAGWWIWQGAHSSTPVDSTAAVSEFRSAATADVAPRAGVPAAGVYRFRVTGEEAAGSGVLSAERPLPGEAVYIITPDEAGYHEDLRFSEEHAEEARFRVDAEGSTAVWRRTKVMFLGMGTDDRDDVKPAALDHPATMKPGATWGGEYKLGDLVVTYTAKVTGTGTATIDGKRVKTVTFRTEATYTGSTPGDRTDVVTWAPALSLPVAWSIDQTTGGDAAFTMTADMELVSTTPER